MTAPLPIQTHRGKLIDAMTAEELRVAYREQGARFQATVAWYQKRLRTSAVLSLDEALRGPGLDPIPAGSIHMRRRFDRVMLALGLVLCVCVIVLLFGFGVLR